MLRPIAPPFALVLLWWGLAAVAQAAPTGRPAPRTLVLTGQTGEAPLIYLSPGTVTVLLFDAPLVREAVEVEGRARFAVMDVGDLTITLSPSVALPPGERLALRIHYREGAPARAVFLLTGQPGVVDDVVNVRRPQQTVETCRVELSALRERCEVQSQELEALKARLPALSPAAVALAGVVDEGGLEVNTCWKAHRGVPRELPLVECKLLGASTWTVAVLKVRNVGAEPWAPAWAEVTPGAGGAPRRAREVLTGQASLPPGGSVSVAVEVEMPTRQWGARLNALHTLRVCGSDGSRCVSVPNVNL